MKQITVKVEEPVFGRLVFYVRAIKVCDQPADPLQAFAAMIMQGLARGAETITIGEASHGEEANREETETEAGGG